MQVQALPADVKVKRMNRSKGAALGFTQWSNAQGWGFPAAFAKCARSELEAQALGDRTSGQWSGSK